MKTFKYNARSQAGSQIEGFIEANSSEEAVASLRGNNVIVTSIEQTGSEGGININIGRKKVKPKVLSLMCNQFAIILRAGLPIVRTVELVAGQIDNKLLSQTLSDVADDLAAGYGLAMSFEKHGSYLPRTFIETIRAGEDSGNLETVFRRLSEYYEKTAKTKSKVASSLIYPCFVIGIAVIVVIVIMVFAVPSFTSSFEGMNIELPFVTVALIACSNFFVNFGLILLGVIVALVIAFRVAVRTNDGFHEKVSRFALKIPILGRIQLMNGSSQFAATMGIMLSAGLSVVNSVGVTARSTSNFFLARKLETTLLDLEAGKRLASTLQKTEAFPNLLVEMTAVGEETGSLEDTLSIVSEYYDNEVEVSTARALSLMEPIIIVFLAVIVCVILLAVYLPMFSLYSAF